VFQDLLDPQLLPEALQDQRRSDLRDSGTHLRSSGEHQEGFLGVAGQGADESFDLPLVLQSVQAADGADDSLHDFAFDLTIFDDLEVLVVAGLFDACEHGSSPL